MTVMDCLDGSRSRDDSNGLFTGSMRLPCVESVGGRSNKSLEKREGHDAVGLY